MKPHRTIWACAAILAVYLPSAQAQTQQPQGAASNIPRQMPAPAARGLLLDPDANPQSPSQVRPDTHTLSSIETLGIGTLCALRSIFEPSISFSQSGDTGITAGRVSSATSLGMNLSFDRNWSQSRLTGAY